MAPGTPVVNIGDASLTEGHAGTGSASFAVTLSTASSQPITVTYGTANGSAAAGSDYQSASGTLTFDPGQTTKTVSVLVNGDRAGEPNETFVVNLSLISGGAVIADAQGAGTIVDDEPRVSIDSVSKNEGNSGTTQFVFTVSLSAASDAAVSLNFATANGSAFTRSGQDARVGPSRTRAPPPFPVANASGLVLMPGVFICYRHEDSAGHAGRLFDRLRAAIGHNRVFMDITGIEAGVDFVDTIERAVASCDLLLTVIGPEWLTCTDATGRRRLDDPGDFTRIEIAAALKRKVRVIPVLIGGTSMPAAHALPDEIRSLARRQAVELRDTRWDADADDLISVLEHVLGSVASEQRPRRSVAQVAQVEDFPLRVSPLEPPVGQPRQNQNVIPTQTSRQLWAIAAMAGSAAAVMLLLFWLIPLLSRKPVKPAETTNRMVAPAQVPEAATSTEPPKKVVPPARDDEPTLDKSAPEPPSGKTANEAGDPATAADVRVPHVEGLPLATAAQMMRRAGLIVDPGKSVSAPGVRAFVVTAQKPAPGTMVAPRSHVTLVYTVPGRTVPDLTGLPLKAALSELAALRFLGGELTAEPTNKVRPNQVLRQSPPPGTELEPGARIDLVYATTPALKVPNVTSRSATDATAMLERLGFTVQITYEDSDRVQAGNVLRQSPSAGEMSTDDKPTVVLIVARPPASSSSFESPLA